MRGHARASLPTRTGYHADTLADQAAGGLVMWATSGVIGLVTLMVLIHRLLEQEERPHHLECAGEGERTRW